MPDHHTKMMQNHMFSRILTDVLSSFIFSNSGRKMKYLSKQEKIPVLSSVIMMSQISKYKKEKLKKKPKRFWSREWLLRRYSGKDFTHLVDNELRLEDPESFKNFTRLSRDCFDKLLDLVGPLISKQNTVLREAISPTTRLLITLRYLASGNSFKDLSYGFRVSRQAISSIVPDTLEALYKTLLHNYMKGCQSASEWEDVANDFKTLWNFPMCLGAIDGKHIAIRVQHTDGSYYYNYKGFNSIILLAVVDAKYKFIMVDVGTNGRANDAAAFNVSTIGKVIKENLLNFPNDDVLPGTNTKVPFVFVSDEAFRLSSRVLKPFSDRKAVENKIFNYRLSRARRVVENAFGILSNRFKIFQKQINLSPEKAEIITLASCALHNFLISEGEDITTYLEDVSKTNSLQKCPGNKCSTEAKDVRNNFAFYFNNTDVLPWQNEAIQKFNF